MKIFLPRVEELTLDACFDMPTFEFLKEGHPSHARWNLAPEENDTSFKLSLKNAGLSKSAISNLRGSGRVLNPSALDQKIDHTQGKYNEWSSEYLFIMQLLFVYILFWRHTLCGLTRMDRIRNYFSFVFFE